MPMTQHLYKTGQMNLSVHPLQRLTILAKSLASDSMIRKRKLYGSAQVLEMIKFCYQEKNLNGQKTR